MASRVVYIERSDRGSRLNGVRLISPRADDAWTAPRAAAERAEAEDSAVPEAAAWIAARVTPPGKIAMLVLDADGGVCAWATVPGHDPGVVEAVVRQQADGIGDPRQADADSSSARADVLWYYAPGQSDSTIQSLVSSRLDPASEFDSRERAAVLAVGDGMGRVLVDQIDRMGIECGVACTIWHAMAAAWDPSGQWRAPHPAGPDKVVAESAAGVTAVLLVEPSGKLLWAWSREGRLLAAGSMRLPMRRDASAEAPQDIPLLPGDCAARLAGDWLAWSAQIAVAPSRVVMLVPTIAQDESEGSLGAGGFGRAVARGWQGAAVDVAVHDDPVGATLRRVSELIEERDGMLTVEETLDPSRTLVALTVRPGGAHRKLYIWSSLAVTAGAVVVGALAWGLRLQATRLGTLTRQVESSWKDTFKEVKLARPPMPGMEDKELHIEVERVRRESMPIAGVEQARPIVREFETLSNVLALPDFELTSISIDSRAGTVSIQVNAPDLASAEALSDALGRIAGSDVTSWSFSPGGRAPGSDKVPCSYTGVLAAPPGPPPAPAGGSS